MRFAILSNIVPPSPYGQSIVLYRLLNNVPSDRYYFITEEATTTATLASAALPVSTFHMGIPPRRKWSSPLDFVKRAYRRLQGRSGQMENFIHLRARQISKIIQQNPCCALVACTGDLVNLPAAAIACAENSLPFVPYILDDYAYHLVGWEREIAQRHIQPMMTQAKQVLFANEATVAEYQRRYHISAATVIHHPTPMPDLNRVETQPLILDKATFNIVFTGAIYHAHYDAFRNLIQALELLPPKTAMLHVFTAQTPEEIAAQGIQGDCLRIHPHLHVSHVSALLQEADLLFLALAFEAPTQEVLRLATPTKMGDYLAAARPILVHAPAEDFICQYFHKHECGIVVDQPDPKLLAQVISDLIAGKIDTALLTKRARQLAELDFAVDRVQTQFLEVMQKACSSS